MSEHKYEGRWKVIVKKKKAIEDVSFQNVIAVVKDVLMPVVDAIQADSKFDKIWFCGEKR